MSLNRWHRLAVFAAFVGCGCGGSVEAGSEHAATKAQALVVTVPGRIEAESYERSLDSTPDVNFGAYVSECDRKDGVDIDRSEDPNDGGCVIGWTTAGEWLEYDLQVPSAQSVDITARVASDLVDRQFHISIDGTSLPEQTLPSDVSWDYTDVTSSGVALSAGAHVLRFTFDSDSINLNYIDVSASSPAASAGPLVETLLPVAAVVASSQESDAFPPALATDGDSKTRWSSQFNDPQWIYVDLGKTQQVSRAILNWEVAASQSYEIGVSDSSEGPWQVVYATTTGDGGLDDISFAPVSARYVRMYSKARTTYFGVSLYDFDVYGVIAPDPSCTPNIANAPDDGALIPTGNLSAALPNGPPYPNPTLVPVYTPPTEDGDQCVFNCFDGSVLDGNTLAASGAFNGKVYVYVKGADGTWTFQARLANPELGPTDPTDHSFGPDLSLSGDELMVAGTSPAGVGKVYVFARAGASWTLAQTLVVGAFKVLLVQGTALVTTAQGVRLYQRGASGQYRLQTVFDKPAGLNGVDPADQTASFGGSLALDQNVALIGAPFGRYAVGMGSAYAYTRCAGQWSFAQSFAPADGNVSSNFGAAVGASGTQLAISAPSAAEPDSNRPGFVNIYERQGSQWQLTQTIVNPILFDGYFRRFGNALALKNHLLLSTFDISYPYSGGSYTYLFDVSGTPRFLAALFSGEGRSVALSGSQALIDVNGLRYGTVPDVFSLSP